MSYNHFFGIFRIFLNFANPLSIKGRFKMLTPYTYRYTTCQQAYHYSEVTVNKNMVSVGKVTTRFGIAGKRICRFTFDKYYPVFFSRSLCKIVCKKRFQMLHYLHRNGIYAGFVQTSSNNYHAHIQKQYNHTINVMLNLTSSRIETCYFIHYVFLLAEKKVCYNCVVPVY